MIDGLTTPEQVLRMMDAWWQHMARGGAKDAVHSYWKAVLKDHLNERKRLAAMPGVTPDDLKLMDAYIRWARHEVDSSDRDRQSDNRREKTRERVRRYRERQQATKQ